MVNKKLMEFAGTQALNPSVRQSFKTAINGY